MTAPYARTALPEDPPWLKTAFAEVGIQEIIGYANNPRIVGYHACTGLGAGDDETPWCSSFMCWVMQQHDIMSTRSAASLSWLRWGKELDVPVRGCVVVYERTDVKGNIIPNRGHVGLWLGENGVVTHTLGGNQRNQVGVNSYMTERVVGYRWPSLPTNSTTVMASTTAAAGTMAAAAPGIMGLITSVSSHKEELSGAVDTAKSVAGGLGVNLTNSASIIGLVITLAAVIYIVRERNKKIKKFGI